MSEHSGNYCCASIIYCPSAPPPGVLELGGHEVLLENARAAREAGYGEAGAPERQPWEEHRVKTEEIYGAQMISYPDLGVAHPVSMGSHQVQIFATPVMDDLGPFAKMEPFYDGLGGAAFSVNTDPNKRTKPLICRLCLRPVRVLTIKHPERYDACPLNRAQDIAPVAASPEALAPEAQRQELSVSNGAPMPTFLSMPQSAGAPVGAPPPVIPTAPPLTAMPSQPMPQTPAFSGGGIPCRTGFGDGSNL